MNAATFFHPQAPIEPRFDVSIDATQEWREVSIFDDCEDRAEALFRGDWEQEPRGADDVGRWVDVFELVGLRITTATGAVIVIDRREAIDALGLVAVAAMEQAMADAANFE